MQRRVACARILGRDRCRNSACVVRDGICDRAAIGGGGRRRRHGRICTVGRLLRGLRGTAVACIASLFGVAVTAAGIIAVAALILCACRLRGLICVGLRCRCLRLCRRRGCLAMRRGLERLHQRVELRGAGSFARRLRGRNNLWRGVGSRRRGAGSQRVQQRILQCSQRFCCRFRVAAVCSRRFRSLRARRRVNRILVHDQAGIGRDDPRRSARDSRSAVVLRRHRIGRFVITRPCLRSVHDGGRRRVLFLRGARDFGSAAVLTRHWAFRFVKRGTHLHFGHYSRGRRVLFLRGARGFGSAAVLTGHQAFRFVKRGTRLRFVHHGRGRRVLFLRGARGFGSAAVLTQHRAFRFVQRGTRLHFGHYSRGRRDLFLRRAGLRTGRGFLRIDRRRFWRAGIWRLHGCCPPRIGDLWHRDGDVRACGLRARGIRGCGRACCGHGFRRRGMRPGERIAHLRRRCTGGICLSEHRAEIGIVRSRLCGRDAARGCGDRHRKNGGVVRRNCTRCD